MKSVIQYPVVTEKASTSMSMNQYVFAVDLAANKFEIKKAVEALKKDIKVISVKTMVIRGKIKRMGMRSGKRSNWKKAIVRLKAGQTLEVLESA